MALSKHMSLLNDNTFFTYDIFGLCMETIYWSLCMIALHRVIHIQNSLNWQMARRHYQQTQQHFEGKNFEGCPHSISIQTAVACVSDVLVHCFATRPFIETITSYVNNIMYIITLSLSSYLVIQ